MNIEQQRAAFEVWEKIAPVITPFAAWKAGIAAIELDRQGRGGTEEGERAKYLASLFPEDRMFEEIDEMARESFRRHSVVKRGQMVMRGDAWDSHVVWATKCWIEANEPATPQPAATVVKESLMVAEPVKPTPARERIAKLRQDPAKAAALDRAQTRIASAVAEPVKVQSDADEIPDAVKYYGTVEDINAVQPDPSMAGDEWVKSILAEFPLLDDEGLDENEHHCEWALQQDRKRLHALLKRVHPASGDDATCK